DDPNGHWGEQCAVCHTVGYSKAATNGGWDEAMTAEGWKVPPHGDRGTWASIVAKYPKMASLSNIQCENCHGPNNASGLHDNKKIDIERVSIKSDVCGSCHGEPPRHGRFQQWEESGHANFELAIEEATVEKRGPLAAHCGRCHSGQGFLAWIKQGDLTKLIQGKSGNATVDELRALGLTRDTVQPQTCSTCHDPHDVGTASGEPSKTKVRIMDNTLLLPAGFKAEIVGKGALCITCHNTRNGIHDISAPPTSFSAPHTAAQGDVLMGENAYLVPVEARSPHSLIKDTCVTCHLNETPPPAEYSFNLGGTNHAFKASKDICGSCHTKTLNAEGMQKNIEEKLHELGAKMSKYLLNKMPANIVIKDYTPHNFNNKFYDLKSDTFSINKNDIASVEPAEPHGQQGFLIKFKGAVTFTYKPANEQPHTVNMMEAEVQLGDITSDGTKPIIPTTDILVKAGWNFFLIEGDGSMGVHNPQFTRDVLNASIEALK
ncbi:MAG: hypothetical protein Q8O16_07875, partial [Dehalococcoidia bacterium]|nr:hypothetical protein [Dehalococcoidia bacterium]